MGTVAFCALNPVTLQRGSRHSYNPRRGKTPCARIGDRALGVDYGLRRVGVAVSVGFAPRPLPRIEHERNPKQAAYAVAKTASGSVANTIVVGMPLNSAGIEGEQAAATRIFMLELALAAPWAKIFSLDERYTSSAAKETLLEAGVSPADVPLFIDSASAVSLLERYFSDLDESAPVLYHAPDTLPQVELDVSIGNADGDLNVRPTFAEWKARAIARAGSDHSRSTNRKKK